MERMPNVEVIFNADGSPVDLLIDDMSFVCRGFTVTDDIATALIELPVGRVKFTYPESGSGAYA